MNNLEEKKLLIWRCPHSQKVLSKSKYYFLLAFRSLRSHGSRKKQYVDFDSFSLLTLAKVDHTC